MRISEGMELTSEFTSACARSMRHAETSENHVGIAYVAAMFFPEPSFGRSLFGRIVAHNFRASFETISEADTRWAAVAVAYRKYWELLMLWQFNDCSAKTMFG